MDKSDGMSTLNHATYDLRIGFSECGEVGMRYRCCFMGRPPGFPCNAAAFTLRIGLPNLRHLMLFIVLLFSSVSVAALSNPAGADQRAFLPKKPQQPARAAANTSGILRNFEVDPPIYTPTPARCQQILMTYSFGNSYGQPFIGQ